MGLFDKKYCDVCGEKIGLLGNRKLEDANLCKNCAAKLSPWFNERRHSTLEEIKEQLAYREDNKESVKAFHTTRSFGKYTKLLLDEDARKFMVTSARDLEEANPDVLDFSQVTGCDLEIDEDRDEIKHKDKEGNMVSYDPPRYEYSYDFDMVIRVNHPYFDTMKFQLNSSRVNTGSRSMNRANTGVNSAASMISAALGFGKIEDNEAGFHEYNNYVAMGEEIKAILMQARQQVRNEQAEAAEEPKAVTCPFCLATTFPDKNGRCEYCGGAIL